MIKKIALLNIILCSFFAGKAFADEGISSSWQLNLQKPISSLGERLNSFHNDLLIPIIFAIAIFVICLVIFVMFRFRESANPEPSKTTHNVLIEIIWTIIPISILTVIAIPSFQLLFYQQTMPEFDMRLKITGYQWYWGYEYLDHDGINFNSYMIPDEEINAAAGQKRLLETDNPVVLPVGKNIQLLFTSEDVIHAWTIPAGGVKKDANPGELTESWINIDKPGTYYGQCSEICGTGHAYMPIMIKAVTEDEFNAWVITAKEKFASNDNSIGMQGSQNALAVTQ